MVAASLLSCLIISGQDPEAATLGAKLEPRTSNFALTVYEAETKHTQNGQIHWHLPLFASGGAIRIHDNGKGSLSFRADWNESRAKVQCDGSILYHIGKITRSEAELIAIRDEQGQIEAVRASFRGFMPDPGRFAALDPTHTTPIDPFHDVRFEKLNSFSSAVGVRTPKGIQFTQTGQIGWFGPRTEGLVKVHDTRKLYVSTAEALLASPARLREFAEAAKKGEAAEFDVLTMPGIVRYRLHYAGPQWTVFPNFSATLDRFELRAEREKRTPYGSFWLDEKGQLVLFSSASKDDLADTSMFGSFGTPSGPEIDPTRVWPVMMTLDQIWKLPPPPRKRQ